MPGITDPAEEYFKDGIWGWDGSAWRKLPLVWGYSDHYSQRVYTVNAATGVNALTFTAVPVGEVRVILGMTAYNNTSTITRVEFKVWAAAIPITLYWEDTPVLQDLVKFYGNVVLKAGNYLQASFSGCTAGDDLWGYAWGYKMKVAG